MSLHFPADTIVPGGPVPAGHHRALSHGHPEEQGGLLDSLRLQWPEACIQVSVSPPSPSLAHDTLTRWFEADM